MALTEAMTRRADGEDPVPDVVWEEAARCYGGKELAGSDAAPPQTAQ